MAGVRRLVCFLGVALLPLPRTARADLALPAVIELVADRDDDDLDGVPDGDAAFVASAARVDAVPLAGGFTGVTLTPTSGAEHARVLAAGRPVAWGTPLPKGAMLQGVTPGLVVIEARARHGESSQLTVVVTGVGLRDGEGRDVDFTRSHASLDRSVPSQVNGDASALYDEPDPLRLYVVTPGDREAPTIRVESVAATGAHLDSLPPPTLSVVACTEPDPSRRLRCFASEPLRFVIDEVDSHHILASGRSLRAELGGAIVLRRDGRKAQAIRVEGPRKGPAGPIGRLRATVRPFVLRLTPGGVPAIGGNELGAVAALRAELTQAASAWGECGVTFGPPADIAVHVVDPPPAYLLAVGDALGLPASGGHVRVRVDGQKNVEITTRNGQLPIEVAREAARQFERAGFVATVSPNARVGSGASASVDVLVRRKGGGFAHLEPLEPGMPVADDGSMTVRIGSVDLADGLTHFSDIDAVAGTLEERTLLKSLDDGDPSTLEVVVIPFFAGGGRIGESFIGTDRSSLRNVVLLDRAGVRARRASLTLAHELGHVLLDVPGHPDDYGIDTPTRLMDADASDASPFGPRRLTLAECARVVRESGPGARAPLLREWPLTPLVYP